MLEIGKFNELEVRAMDKRGATLASSEGDLQLPAKLVPAGTEVGGRLQVFVYQGQNGELEVTTATPKVQVGEFAYLEVVDVSRYGAFLDWGLEKDLFLPYSEQRVELQKGDKYIVRVYLDKIKKRITATTKIEKYLTNEHIPYFEGEEVNLLVYALTDLGAKVIIDNQFDGLVYQSDIYQDIQIGDELSGYIGKIREDGKIDVSLRLTGRKGAEDSKEVVLEKLRENNNFLPLTDDSSPEEIRDQLNMSKKMFKKAIGGLYKERQVELKEDGVYLLHR